MTRRRASILLALAAVGCAPKAPVDVPATPAPAARDFRPVAEALTKAGMIGEGDRVLISGTGSQQDVLDEIALGVMKAGGEPLVTISSESFARRSYDEVPAKFDSKPPRLGVGLIGITDVQITVDFGDNDTLMKGVPAERMAARAKAGEPANEAYFKSTMRAVNLGNGLYPSAKLAATLGKSEAELADIFWNSVGTSSDTLRAHGTHVMNGLQGAKEIHITAANGTDITFSMNMARTFISDGVLTPEKVKAGSASASTWLPAGEILGPINAGSGTGKVVVDKLRAGGVLVEGLTLTFANGKLTEMTATSGIEAVKQRYDASGGGKDLLSFIDIGVNPAVTGLPTNAGRVVWVASGGITLGVGDNRGWGGSNVSDYTLTAPLTNATLMADGKTIIKDGKLQ